ncbi:hypothetical protein DXG03_004324, partial [Asterophora parasitica]
MSASLLRRFSGATFKHTQRQKAAQRRLLSTPPHATPKAWRPLATASAVAAFSAAAYTLGSIYPPSALTILFPRTAPAPLDPTTPEARAYTDALEQSLQTLPLLESLRERADADDWYEVRPYTNFPEERRVNSLTSGSLRGPGKLALFPLVRAKKDESESYVFTHVGRGLCGHDGIIHGGLLATLLDETLARTDEEVEVIPHPSAPSLEHTLSFSQAVPSRSPTVEVLIAESVHLVKEKRKAMAGVSMEENEDENVGDDAGFSSTQVRVADADEEKPLLVERRRRTSSTLEAGNPPDIQDPEEQPPKRRGVQAVFGLTTSPSELQAQRAVPQRVDVNRPPQPSNPNPGIAFRAGLRSTGLIRHGNFKRQVDSTSSPVATVLATRGVNGVFPSTPPVPTPATTSRAVAVLKPPTARAPTPPRAVPVPSTFIHERRSAFRASGKWVRPIPPPAARCPSSALPAQRGSSSPKRQ